VRARKARFLLGESGLNFFRGQNKWDEHGLAACVGLIGVRRGRQTGQAVAAVDQLFDCEEQELILRHGKGEGRIADWPEILSRCFNRQSQTNCLGHGRQSR